MKYISIISVVTAFVCSMLLASPAYADPTAAEFQDVLDEYATERNFSGTVLIARRGEIVLEASYADAIVEWGVPNSPDARYRIGSLSKPFLATLIMRLSETGALSLDGTLRQYLPDLYANTPAEAVTVAQLLSHTSGLQDVPGNFGDPWYQTTARLSFEPREFAAEWIKPIMLETPGTKWSYNNAGFILLGIIVEEATGQSYAANLQEHIFDPAGMEDSGFFSDADVLRQMANGYARAPTGELIQPTRVDSSIFFSAAGIYATARDIFRFDTALYGSDVVSAASRSAMHSKKTDFGYGFGWGVEQWAAGDDELLDVVHHTGSIPGFQSFYIRSEADQYCVIVLNNTNSGALVIEMGRNLMLMLNNGKAPLIQQSLDDYLTPIAYRDGAESMIAAMHGLSEQLDDFDTSERAINRLGYKYLGLSRVDEAIAVLVWATQLYPDSANTHDSLGEAYRTAGMTDEAIKSYERAVAIDPESPSALTALEELRAE